MQRKILRTIALRIFALVVVLGAEWQAQAQNAKVHRIRAWPRPA
jgi:hypothetical protein